MDLTRIFSRSGPSESQILKKGHDMIVKTFEEQKSYGEKLQEKFHALTQADILTTTLPLRDDIPQQIKDRVLAFQGRITQIILGVAVELQELNFRSIDSEVKSAGLSKFQERRYGQVREARKEIYASYDAIRESLNYITKFNEYVLSKLEGATGAKKTDLLLLNAIIVHELTNVIINLIEDFELRGKETLRSINDQVLDELRIQQTADTELWERASNGQNQVEAAVRKSIEDRYEIRGLIVKKWEKTWEQIGELEKSVSNTKGYLPTLELIRDNAKGQINILEVIVIAQIVESNIKSFQEICAITNMKLAPLTKEDVFGLIGKFEEIPDK